MKNNPNKANQHVPDPRQSLFLSYFLDPKSETFSNAYKSALKAGYEDEYAKVITSDSKGLTWLSEAVNDSYIVQKAEQNLKEFIEMETKNNQATKSGEVFEFDDPALKRIKSDMTKFALERLKKSKYSQRQEHSGPDGEPIEVTIVEDKSLKKSDNS